jgi:hypothetical protein
MRIAGVRFSTIWLVVMLAVTTAVSWLPSPWWWVGWTTAAVITAGCLLYAHFSQSRWIRVCGYCGKEHCRVAHRWTYRQKHARRR